MAPNAEIAMRVEDWKILANAELTEFELYDLKDDTKETTDLKDKEPARLAEMKQKLIAHNTAINTEGPDWWQRLSPNGGTDPKKAGGKKKKKAE
jgi:arylsulfatase A-like enzyme